MNSFDRLRQLQADNDKAGREMDLERGRFAALASRHENGTAPRAVSSFNLFQTPAPIAERMARLCVGHAGHGAKILEPSAGLGRIYREIVQADPTCRVHLVENSPECVRELYGMTEDDKGARLIARDFLEVTPEDAGGPFDAVCMNPPFKQGTDVKHIRHALGMLKPGGLLVSLCYDGEKQNRVLKPIADTWEILPAGSFKSSGTMASVILLTMKKNT